MTIEDFEKALPPHKASLRLTHNPHLSYYENVSQYMTDNTCFDWVSEAEREAAEGAGEMWTMQVYPDTPVGFYGAAAHSLEALLRAVQE